MGRFEAVCCAREAMRRRLVRAGFRRMQIAEKICGCGEETVERVPQGAGRGKTERG